MCRWNFPVSRTLSLSEDPLDSLMVSGCRLNHFSMLYNLAFIIDASSILPRSFQRTQPFTQSWLSSAAPLSLSSQLSTSSRKLLRRLRIPFPIRFQDPLSSPAFSMRLSVILPMDACSLCFPINSQQCDTTDARVIDTWIKPQHRVSISHTRMETLSSCVPITPRP